MCVLYFFLCSNGHDSPGNPSQSSISQPVSRFSPVFPGPCWYPIHNTTLGSPLPACNPSILSNQSALFQQEHISTVTDGGFHNIWCSESGREGEKWVENEKKVWELSWSRCGMEILDQHDVLLSLSIQVSERAVSCQCLPATEWRLLAVMLLMFLTVTFVTALPHSFSLILCLSPTLTFFLSLPPPNFLFPLSFSRLHFLRVLPSHQPSAAVRGYHSSKAAATSPGLGSNWTAGSSGGQGARSGPSFTRSSLQHYLSHHQQHPHHHPQSTHTSYAYCQAHTAVSTADFFLFPFTRCLSVSSGLFVALIS